MDRDRFDAIVRLFAPRRSRRGAIAALLGAALFGQIPEGEAKRRKTNHRKGGHDRQSPKQKRQSHDKNEQRGTGHDSPPRPVPEISAEAADCSSPGPDSNLNGCNFNGQNFVNRDLSSSSMVGTTFTNADLCGADLSSSQLRNAVFNGANLTKADLSSSGCNGTRFNAATVFCRTRTCNGSLNNSDCPGAAAGSVCCAAGECAERVCQSKDCRNNRCSYTDQPDGQPGTLCAAPRQCCAGGCCGEGQRCCGGQCIGPNVCCTNNQEGCPGGQKCCGGQCIASDRCCTDGRADACDDERKCCGGTCIFKPSCCTNGQEGCPTGQKCCGGQCIAENTCCTNNVPGFCPPETRCCEGECIPPTACCENDTLGCPAAETCVFDTSFQPPAAVCCPDARACGPRCRTTPCVDICGVCNTQTGGCTSICQPFVQSCCFGTCKIANGEACTQDSDCCDQLDEVCGRVTPSGVKICCRENDRLCSSNAECCSGRCVDSFCEEP